MAPTFNPLNMAPYLYGQHQAQQTLPLVRMYYFTVHEKDSTLAKHMIEGTMEPEAFSLVDREKYAEEYKQFAEEYIAGFLNVLTSK